MGSPNLESSFGHSAVVIGRTPFCQTSNDLENHFSNIEQTRMFFFATNSSKKSVHQLVIELF